MDVVKPPRFGGGVSWLEADSKATPGRRSRNESPAAALDSVFMDPLYGVVTFSVMSLLSTTKLSNFAEAKRPMGMPVALNTNIAASFPNHSAAFTSSAMTVAHSFRTRGSHHNPDPPADAALQPFVAGK